MILHACSVSVFTTGDWKQVYPMIGWATKALIRWQSGELWIVVIVGVWIVIGFGILVGKSFGFWIVVVVCFGLPFN